jgi:hypothetical protein
MKKYSTYLAIREWLSSKTKKCWQGYRGGGGKKHSYTVGDIVNWSSHYGNHFGGSSKKPKLSQA